MRLKIVIAVGLLVLFGMTFIPGNAHAQWHRVQLLDICEEMDKTFCKMGSASYVPKYKRGTATAFVEIDYNYVDLTIRIRGSFSRAPHEAWLCYKGEYDGTNFDAEDCIRAEVADGGTPADQNDNWPNVFWTNKPGNSDSYWEWNRPEIFTNFARTRDEAENDCDENHIADCEWPNVVKITFTHTEDPATHGHTDHHPVLANNPETNPLFVN